MKYGYYFSLFLVGFLGHQLYVTKKELSLSPKAPVVWCFQAGDNVGRVEEYEKYLVIFDNATGDFLQAGPIQIRDTINLMFATIDCK